MQLRMEDKQLSKLASVLISLSEKKEAHAQEKKLTVNSVVSKVASLYEKLRNAMEYREEEVILRSTIERILKRRLLLGGNAKTTAEPLVRELIWASYLPDGTVPETVVARVEKSIDFYLRFRLKLLERHKDGEAVINEWIYQLMSSDIEQIVNHNFEKETMSNFMFHILKEHVQITDDTQQTRDAQVFIAVRKAFARDDIAFLRYHLFHQYFGTLSLDNLDHIASEFLSCYKEISKQLAYPRKDTIYTYVKRRSAAFLILEDIIRFQKGQIHALLHNQDEFARIVFTACELRYKKIRSKVNTAIIRSVLFILFTKVIFAFAIEGTYERFFFGRIFWNSILINTGIPPILMIVVGLFIKTPDRSNSKAIFSYIQSVLYEDRPRLGDPLVIKKQREERSVLDTVFSLLWFLAFFLSFGGIVIILTKLHFSIVSEGIFVFFLAIVSFLSYRISQTAQTYRVGDKPGLTTPLIDFLFMPVVRVGQHLTEGISQINVILFVFDFIIETPFKVLFAFFEQWFFFLHNKREELG